MPRYSAVIRFDSPNLDEAKDFARRVRRAARSDVYDWDEHGARLLRVVEPQAEAEPQANAE